MSGELLAYALRITLLPLIKEALESGKTLPEIKYITEQAARRAADRPDPPLYDGGQLDWYAD